eukprot:gene6011-16006_t
MASYASFFKKMDAAEEARHDGRLKSSLEHRGLRDSTI